jgi:hypothetical protein
VGQFEVTGRMTNEPSVTKTAATAPNNAQSHSANRGTATSHSNEWPSIGGQTCADTLTNRLAVHRPTTTPIGNEATLSATAMRRIPQGYLDPSNSATIMSIVQTWSLMPAAIASVRG